ncbi:MAG: glutamine-hydrolyzing GMP synthase [Ignavibacteria bacterium]|nr:glutamine-hydrolyzing GMP synthase [Ignavibacteria bacterium]PJC58598.1 MAG: glutamine-hydrolyzing GMP synthase [Ignavibacteria bacterium CG_4_9_14_0_2_um_filter_37_13]
MNRKNEILIIDFGSQYTQLIARRIREENVFSEIFPHTLSLQEIKKRNPSGIILSGGPMSVYAEDAPDVNSEIFALNIPILGVCYGLQLLAKHLGGKVEKADEREYGKAGFTVSANSKLFSDCELNSSVWMSHGDLVTQVPNGFCITGTSAHSPVCAVENTQKKIYGLQFHPEVAHTVEGKKILHNFLFSVCNCKADWTPAHFVEEKITEIKNKVGSDNVLCALSGGVDSTVAAVLVQKAVGDQLTCVHVDTGLMRKNESEKVVSLFRKHLNLKVISVDASKLFLERLKEVTEPERKRKIIGNTFIELFEQEAAKIPNVKYLVQGTLYPDVIESVSVKGKSVTIKTHHNVGGLPEKMHLKLIEPFRELFKDEVRNVGKALSIPAELIARHPFPGPGLAVRILSDITGEKLSLLCQADEIFIDEIKNENLYDEIWQAFAVLLPVQSVGVMGDSRTYENVLALRAVTSTDGMTADWYPFQPEFLARVSNKIINKVNGINRVVYDISSKPPSTIEWE